MKLLPTIRNSRRNEFHTASKECCIGLGKRQAMQMGTVSTAYETTASLGFTSCQLHGLTTNVIFHSVVHTLVEFKL